MYNCRIEINRYNKGIKDNLFKATINYSCKNMTTSKNIL